MTTPQLMAFVGTEAVGAMPSGGVMPAWQCNQLFFITDGTDPNASGVRNFDAYPNGNPILERTIGEIGLPALSSLTFGCGLSQSEYIVVNQFTSNSTTLAEIYGPTMARFNQFGISSSSLLPSTAKRILTSGSMAPLRISGTDFMISCPLVSNVAECCILTLPGLANVNLGPLDEDKGFCGRGKVTENNLTQGTGWVLGVGGTSTLGMYRVEANSMASIGKIAAASIDPTWVAITGAAGVLYDQTDDNPIIAAFNTDAATGHQSYYVKINATTCAVIWTCSLNDHRPDSVDMVNSVITKQVLYFMAGGGLLFTINTATGVATTTTLNSMSVTGGQISEDIYGSVVLYGSWIDTGTTPEYIGSYMGTGGVHTVTNTWMRWIPGGAISPLPVTCTVPSPGVVSTNKAWTYVQDGHTFYVLDLGTQGTFAFDTVTSQWCQLQTNGSNFAMLNGIMWGQRVVGGDPATTDVWELDPGATTDSGGAYQIDHVSTGGISTRSRTFVSCDAVRISASFGELDEGGTVTFNLRFSDDQEETWSPYYAVTLVEGAFDAEIAWRSLGSFNAPGRIFELSDSGGLIRIDGCDAFLNGFDNDTQDQDASEK